VIPYFEQPQLELGPLTIHAFGVLVAAAVMVGYRVFRRQLAARGLDQLTGDRLFAFIVVGGFVVAHLVDRLIYHPQLTAQNPWTLLRFWEGLSSFGGFVGAVLGAWLFARRRQSRRDAGGSAAGVSSREVWNPSRVPDQSDQAPAWPYLDAVAYAFPFGWIFGRTGCFLAYDHPGAATDFVLGQTYSDGVLRHNLGLEEALFTIAVAALFAWLGRRPRHAGFYLGLLPILYAPFRFALDFWRLKDVRYGALTPGQWGAIALLLVGVWIFRRRPAGGPAAPAGP
jgi:phosphatidylglycerol---prolipoprotein diacylglyceryl transferase